MSQCPAGPSLVEPQRDGLWGTIVRSPAFEREHGSIAGGPRLCHPGISASLFHSTLVPQRSQLLASWSGQNGVLCGRFYPAWLCEDSASSEGTAS